MDMLSTSSLFSPSPVSAGAASSPAAGGAGAAASPSSEGEGSAFGALISVLVGPAAEADDTGHANRGGEPDDIEAEQNGDVSDAVDAMVVDMPPPFLLAPIDTPVVPLSTSAPAFLGSLEGVGAEISGLGPEPVLGEARATEEPSSTGDTSFEPTPAQAGRTASHWGAAGALPIASGRVVARGVESKLGGHGKPAVAEAAATSASESAARTNGHERFEPTSVATNDALLEGIELPATTPVGRLVATEAATVAGGADSPSAPNAVVAGPLLPLQPATGPVGAVEDRPAPAEHQRVAALEPGAAPFDESAATVPLRDPAWASASSAPPAAIGTDSAEGVFVTEIEAGDRALQPESSDQGVKHPSTAAATIGPVAAEPDTQSTAGDSHRGDRRGFAAAQLRDLVADSTAARADRSGDGPTWSLVAGSAASRDAATDPVVTPRVEVSSATDEVQPSLVAAASPWATPEPAALESGLGGAHANQRFTAMLAHTEEFHGPEHVSKQVVRALYLQWRDGVGEAHVQLNPEHLGHVTLSLRVGQGSVAATVVAETETAQRWIESHRDSLQQSLGEQGLKLDRLMVTTSREGRREPPPEEQGQRPRRPNPRRASQGVFEVRV